MRSGHAGRAAALLALLVALLVACSSGGGAQGGDADPLGTVASTQPPAAVGSGYGPPRVLGTIADPDVGESSGLVASRRNPGVYWTHNDSGDEPYLYCLDPAGASCGVWRVTGASARDWEDIAAGPGPEAGVPYVYVGEIGDNLTDQAAVTVYRVKEPVVPGPHGPNAATGGRVPVRADPAATDAAEALRLRYPDGPHNAEALLVHPQSGDVYIVVKEGEPGVYVARAPLRAGTTTTMEKLATLAIGQADRSEVTGADISPDGTRVALATYSTGYELRLPPDAASFDAIWQQPLVRLTLGTRAQGEAIAYRLDGNALLTTTERPGGLSAPIHEIVRQ